MVSFEHRCQTDVRPLGIQRQLEHFLVQEPKTCILHRAFKRDRTVFPRSVDYSRCEKVNERQDNRFESKHVHTDSVVRVPCGLYVEVSDVEVELHAWVDVHVESLLI